MLSMWVSDGRWDAHLERILASARAKYEVTFLHCASTASPTCTSLCPTVASIFG